jgi:hypothetical protein
MRFKKKARDSFLSMNQKAQASAPFELFVAVIIMTFVIILGHSLLITVQTEICLNSVDKAMTDFKSSLEDTVNTRTSKRFSFQPESSCFDSKETIMNISVEDNARVCAARCDFASDTGCYLMTFQNPNITSANATNFKTKCLNLPPLVSFLSAESDYCSNEAFTADGFELIDLSTAKIQRGTYYLVNATRANDTYPMICVWYKIK